MKHVNKLLKTMAGALCMVGLSCQLSALSFSDAYSIGLVETGEPASPLDEVGYINTLIAQALNSGPTTIAGHDYTRTGNDFGALPTAVVAGANAGQTGNTGIDVTGFTYLLGKYDGPNGGDYVWYVGNLSGTVDIPADSAPWAVNRPGNGYGLSHWSLYNPSGDRVPDAGTTLMLLGSAFAGLSLVRRKRGNA
jgi:hypothetical protein